MSAHRVDPWRRVADVVGEPRAFVAYQAVGRVNGMLLAWRPVRTPLVCWGPGRSGSYLLYDLLSLHPDATCPRGSNRPALGIYGSAHHGPTGLVDRSASPFAPIEGMKRLVGRPIGLVDDRALTASEVDQVRRSFAHEANRSIRPRAFLDKAPAYTFQAALLDRVLPTARHVCCLRDWRDLVPSTIRRMSEPDALAADGSWGWRPAGWDDVRDQPLEARATFLVLAALEQAVRNHELFGDRMVVSSHQRLCDDTHGQLRKVLAHWGLRADRQPWDLIPARFSAKSAAAELPPIPFDVVVRLDAAEAALRRLEI